MRRLLTSIVVLAALALSCATKVGDHDPEYVTSIDPTQVLSDLDTSGRIRLCLDVKSILGAERRARGYCNEAAMFFSGDCLSQYQRCIDQASSEEIGDPSDCFQFAQELGNCRRLTVADYSACATARLRVLADMADDAPGMCTSPSKELASEYFQPLADCRSFHDTCPAVEDLPSL